MYEVQRGKHVKAHGCGVALLSPPSRLYKSLLSLFAPNTPFLSFCPSLASLLFLGGVDVLGAMLAASLGVNWLLNLIVPAPTLTTCSPPLPWSLRKMTPSPSSLSPLKVWWSRIATRNCVSAVQLALKVSLSCYQAKSLPSVFLMALLL